MPTTPDADQPLSLRAVRASLHRLCAMPQGALRVLAGRPRTVDGQTLLPEAQLAVRFLASAPGESFERLPVPEARAEMAAEGWIFGSDVHLAAVDDITVQGAAGPLPARRYDAAPGRPAAGVIVWFHGGGYVLGDEGLHESVCRLLARASGLVVVSVAYRLAPEHPFPAAPDDAIAATRDVVARLDELAPGAAARVVVAGESAGGGLAAIVAQHVEGLAGQVLVCPWLDLSQEATSARSYELFGEGYTLTREQLAWYRAHYLLDASEGDDVLASPGRATDLAGLPGAAVVVLGFDPLRDEARSYAARLDAAGVPTWVLEEPGLPHSAVNATGVSRRVRDIVDALAQAARRLADGEPPAPAVVTAPGTDTDVETARSDAPTEPPTA